MIIIPNWCLSNQHASSITLVLALSNRSPVDALLVSVTSSCGSGCTSTNYAVPRNDAIIAKVDNVILRSVGDEAYILIKIGVNFHMPQFCDLVRINKLRIDRNSSSKYCCSIDQVDSAIQARRGQLRPKGEPA